MALTRTRASALFLFAAVLTVSGQQSSPVNRPWPPEVQTVSPESPALSPADALKTFYMPPGYRIELVASEPLVQDPIVMDWDARHAKEPRKNVHTRLVLGRGEGLIRVRTINGNVVLRRASSSGQ